MLGAIYGDILGSIYEYQNIKTDEFPLLSHRCFFTDDTVLTIAVAQTLLYLDGHPDEPTPRDQCYARQFMAYYDRYPNAGYGSMFIRWAKEKKLVRSASFGNGAPMRITPVGYAFDTLEEVLKEARTTCRYTHNHPDAIAGAQATAACVFLARTGASKQTIKAFVEKQFNYDLNFTLDEIRESYKYEIQASRCVPQSIVAFLESHDYESAIRKVISIGGDSDTLAAITGGIAGAFYKDIPNDIFDFCWNKLDGSLKQVCRNFCERYKCF